MGGWRSRRLVWLKHHSVDGKLVAQVVEDVVGGCSQTASVDEGEVGGHEEVRQVVIVDFASDGLVAARWTGVLQNGFVVLRVYPN